MVNYKEFLNTDLWMPSFYGAGCALSFSLWVLVAMFMLDSYGADMSLWQFKLGVLLGFLGNYYYGIRRYQKQIKEKLEGE